MAATIVLVDTDVLIELLRGRPKAGAWLQSAQSHTVKLHGIVAMEILSGSGNKVEMARHHRFVSQFSIVWPTQTEFDIAYNLLREQRLATGIGLPDCLIAATALERDWELYTFNLKHYRHISGLNVQAPYQR